MRHLGVLLLLIICLPANKAYAFDENGKGDTTYINKLNELAFGIRDNDPLKAQNLCREALRLSIEDGYLKGQDKAYLIIGIMFFKQSVYDSALFYYNKSLEIREKRNDLKGIANALHNIGLVHFSKGNNVTALDYFERSGAIRNKIKDQAGLWTTYQTLGNLHEQLNVPDKAMMYYNLALPIVKGLGDEEGTAGVLMSLGLAYASLENFPKALVYYIQALELSKKTGNKFSEATIRHNIGDLYKHTGPLATALNYFTESIKIKKSIGDRRGICTSLLSLGEVYGIMGNRVIALVYAEECRDMSIEVGAKDVLRSAYLLVADLQEKLGNYPDALSSLKEYESLNGNSDRQKSSAILSDIEKKRELEQQATYIKLLKKDTDLQKLKIKHQEAQNESANLWNTMLLSVFSLITIIVLVMLNSIRLQRIANQDLEDKQEEILRQRDDLEEKNRLINRQIELVQQKNKEITDSITYARRIQTAMLPAAERMPAYFRDHFVFYQPRDIVSGDFYWCTQISPDNIVLALGDCVGHGVPGAFMTVMGIALMNEIVIEGHITDPVEIVTDLDKKVYASLRTQTSDPDAGGEMDIAVISINPFEKTLKFCGAHSLLYRVHAGAIEQIKGDKFSIGSPPLDEKAFTSHTINYAEGDMIYMSSDGFADQFGGTYLKKFMTKNLRMVLEKISPEKCLDQRVMLENEFFAWKGNAPQTDDVSVIGVRL
ncbi:MAG: tetratricopeptide repeat protein [Bacteroidota bacterium]